MGPISFSYDLCFLTDDLTIDHDRLAISSDAWIMGDDVEVTGCFLSAAQADVSAHADMESVES